ncbi:MAG: RHS repeat protein [Opitutales bacterium]|nr:RHS repeat protein [Opitutales bacterium]
MTRSYVALTGELASISYNDGTPTETFSYNHLGQLTTVTDSAGTTTKIYDSYGNVATETQGATGATLAFGYDAFGRETTCTISRGQQTIALFGLAYDAATGQLSVGSYGNVEFAYNYLTRTNFLSSVENYFVTKTRTYESARDLPVEIAYNDSVSKLLAKRNDSNPKSCECRYTEIDATLKPPPGAVPFKKPTGGGIVLI